MIALDTNVLVRFLVQDNPEQARLATELMDGLTDRDQGLVGGKVLVELVWVLERAYGFSHSDIAAARDGLLSSVEVLVEDADNVATAVDRYRNDGFGFSDLMIAAAARRAGASELVTSDRNPARFPDVRLLTA